MPALKKIRTRGPLVEPVYKALKHAIITGQIAPGSALYEEPLTKLLGVSRTPLREAFNRLKSDGLIEVVPRKGACVVELDAQDIDDLLEAFPFLCSFSRFESDKSFSPSSTNTIYNFDL